ncbi:hypothetical protein [Marinococcus luteus]|uniref:hypothetical protein n=1 Tax=Marinococcus luteus TaxID=1122204 RepID=UPI002ACC854B|nr:hypothetical protein [Marinococcus luteus]MDZ5783094.1 hypothetical protein [Marinococcus luteus]
MEYREFLEEIVGIIWGGDAESISEGEEEYKNVYNSKLLDLIEEGKTEQEAKNMVIAEIREDYKEYNIDEFLNDTAEKIRKKKQ